MTKRIFNFAAGPCTLPLPVLEQAQREFVEYQGAGMSIIEMSHRGKHVAAMHDKALATMREVLAVPDDFHILVLGGGATLQFTMIPLNLAQGGKRPAHVVAGAWGKKALEDSKKLVHGYAAWSGKEEGYKRVPKDSELTIEPNTAYLHITTNETIGGIRHVAPPKTDLPIVADMSSEFASRPIDWSKYMAVYAGAQKNIGPAGLTVVIVRKDAIAHDTSHLGAYLRFSIHAEKDSMYNTPPVFQIYIMGKVLEWAKNNGGMEGMHTLSKRRAALIYDAIDHSDGYYRSPVNKDDRSLMNIVFRLPREELEAKFIEQASQRDMSGLKGHRDVGGCRASVYNAMPIEGAETLADFMQTFRQANPA